MLTRRQSLDDTHRQVGMGPGAIRKMFVRQDFKRLGISAVLEAGAKEIGEDFVVYKQHGELKIIQCDAVVMAAGVRSRDTSPLVQKCEELGIPYHIIGDAVEVRDALHAAYEGATVALELE